MTTKKEILLIQSIANNLTDSNLASSESNESLSLSSLAELNSETETINKFVKQHRIENFIEIIHLYDELDFKRHFRVSRRTANILIESYKSSAVCPNHNNGGREKLGAEKEMFAFLWYIANTITYQQLANLFGIGYKTAWTVINRVSSWIMSLADTYIKFPQQIPQNISALERLKAVAASHIGQDDGPFAL